MYADGGHDEVELTGRSARCRHKGPSPYCWVVLNGGNGNDTLRLRTRFVPRDMILAMLQGGAGDDRLVVGRTATTSKLHALFVDCGPGDDVLVIPRALNWKAATRELANLGLSDKSGSCERIIRR